MPKENIKNVCAPEMSDHAGLVNLKFLSRGLLKELNVYAIDKTVSYSIVLFNYIGNILPSYQFYSGTKIIHDKVELLLHVCLVFTTRKPLKCTLCRFLLNSYGRKNPKY